MPNIPEILLRFEQLYPGAGTDLKFSSAFELMVAVILSAQSTDIQVNKITERLFKKYSKPEDFARLTPDELAEEIKGCGLYRNKSRFIVETSRLLLERFNGQVPQNRHELENLPGVGRKTANVVLGVAFGQNTFPVDTHVHRLAKRLGFSQGKNPEHVEKDLCTLIPPKYWQSLHHQMIYHGRRVCKARHPLCSSCIFLDLCPSAAVEKEGN